jgi:diguanylate cyclase (GGDEF)-like protein
MALQCSKPNAARGDAADNRMRRMVSLASSAGFIAAALVLVAAALSAFGSRQRRYDGWRWWVAAGWSAAAGAGAAALLPEPLARPLAGLLLLLWPLLALAGLRRFHPRQLLHGNRKLDVGVGAVAAVLSLAGNLGGLPLLAGAATLLAHLYAATVLFLGPSDADYTPVQALAAAMALTAFAPGLAWSAAAAGAGVVVLAFVAITLVCERTERQLRDSRRRLRHLANLDTLTQVPNRRHFAELAEQALRHDEPGTAVLLIFDVDHFKHINDLFGHAAGDRALTVVSSAMLDSLRAMDVPGRQGGDEFVLLLRRTSPRDAMGVAGRIVAEVQRRAPTQQLPTLSLSFGVVQIRVGESIGAAMRRADQAMYEAKRQGRSRAVTAMGDEERPVFSESQRLGLLPA